MAHNEYVELDNSNSSLTKRFRAIHGSYKKTLEKGIDLKKTIGGDLDIGMGDVYTLLSYIFKVRHTEDRTNHGNLSELETFYGYNDPGGTPSNVISMTDHYQSTFDVYMLGSLQENIVGIEVEGLQAWFFVEATFIKIP